MSNETKSLMQRLDSIEEAVEDLEEQMGMVTKILERIVSEVNSVDTAEFPTTDLFDAMASKIGVRTKDKSGDA